MGSKKPPAEPRPANVPTSPPPPRQAKYAGICMWVWSEGYYESTCGNSFYFDAGGRPEEHKFTFCPYCGKHLSSK